MTEDTYETRLGTLFKFGFEEENAGFIIHILEQPAYGNRADDLVSTHRLTTSNGHRLCWTEKIKTLKDAKNIAGVWSDLTENYILTGEKFPTPH